MEIASNILFILGFLLMVASKIWEKINDRKLSKSSRQRRKTLEAQFKDIDDQDKGPSLLIDIALIFFVAGIMIGLSLL